MFAREVANFDPKRKATIGTISSKRIGAQVPEPVVAVQAQTMVDALALEGLAASEAGPGLRRRAVAVNVAPEPVCLTERGHGLFREHPHVAQRDRLSPRQALDRR